MLPSRTACACLCVFVLYIPISYLRIFLIFLLDLNNEEFSAGRGEANDLILTLNDLSEKILSRISKVHFIIKRANCELTNPVYIQVGKIEYINQDLNYIWFGFSLPPLGSLTKRHICEWRKNRHEQNAHIAERRHHCALPSHL